MEPCAVKPYGGSEDFIFVSFCHEDEYRVYPLIENLAREGYRIWYDKGILPGENWTEVISERINACKVFMIMQTVESDASHNCRNEINLAVQLDKVLLCVRLDNAQMSLALRLQLGNSQYVDAEKYNTEEQLLKQIKTCKELKDCKGERDDSIPVVPRTKPIKKGIQSINLNPRQDEPANGVNEPAESLSELNAPAMGVDPTISETKEPNYDGTIADIRGKESNCSMSAISEPDKIETSDQPTQIELPPDDDLSGATVIINQKPDDDNDATQILGSNSLVNKALPSIVHITTGRCYNGGAFQTVIGRDKNSCDIVIPSPDKSISRNHAQLIIRNGKYYVHDENSANGTFVNEQKLEKNASTEVDKFFELRIAGEKLLVMFEDIAEQFRKGSIIGCLTSKVTGETHYFLSEIPLNIGRDFPWRGESMSDKTISRKHAVLSIENNKAILHDKSSNGSIVLRMNSSVIPVKNEECELAEGDRLVFGTQEFVFSKIGYKGE